MRARDRKWKPATRARASMLCATGATCERGRRRTVTNGMGGAAAGERERD